MNLVHIYLARYISKHTFLLVYPELNYFAAPASAVISNRSAEYQALGGDLLVIMRD